MAESLRIGSPPGPPKRRRRRWRDAAIGAAVVLGALVLGAAALGVKYLAETDSQVGAQPSQPPASSAPAALYAEGAVICSVMLPLIKDSADEATAMYEDPDHATTKAEATAGQLRALILSAPEAWRMDIARQYETLEQLVNAGGDRTGLLLVDVHAFGDSGQRLIDGCKPYLVD